MQKIFVIAGPTASGKTAVAIALAKEIGGEIISADSMQVYKYMNIGTAKPTMSERENIPHHMLDIVTPDISYSAALYQQQARDAILDVQTRKKIPILCGGTGFYINAVLRDINFARETDPHSEHFNEIATTHGSAFLHDLLKKTDYASAEAIHPNNTKRIIRALEYFHQTGRPISAHNRAERQKPPQNARIFILHTERQSLYERINRRVDKMLADGLADEVCGLLGMGYSPGLTSMQGIGYKEMVGCITGKYTLPEAVERIKINTRRFAKRQLTWFSGQTEGTWLDVADFAGPVALAERIAGIS